MIKVELKKGNQHRKGKENMNEKKEEKEKEKMEMEEVTGKYIEKGKTEKKSIFRTHISPS
jgi:hypothetical protein